MRENEPRTAFRNIGDPARDERLILRRDNPRIEGERPPRLFAQFGVVPVIADNDHQKFQAFAYRMSGASPAHDPQALDWRGVAEAISYAEAIKEP
jgi:hypothetical protein